MYVILGLALLWMLRPGNIKFIVLNTSPSLPSGLYIRSYRAPEISSLIEFAPPESACSYSTQRWGEVPESARFLKPVVAVSGDHLDATGDVLLLNGRPLGTIQNYDAEGIKLPRWRENRLLVEGEYFVFSSRIPHSFDSRYFGPIHRDEILSVRRPLITW